MATKADADSGAGIPAPNPDAHPAGEVKHGRLMQILRGLAWAAYFNGCCVVINTTQLLGSPLYFVNRELYYAYMALTKQSFALLLTTMTQWWGPTKVRISGDASVAHQIRQTPDGMVEFDFPERLVLIANHQIYTDWIYLWWVAYANSPPMHGHIYIILKESLKYIPVLGWGMMFYGFIFMSRKMATDQPRLAYRLGKLKTRQHKTPDSANSNTDLNPTSSAPSFLNPMWLLLFPEGTNLSGNTRRKSAAWAKKAGLRDPEHLLLPRSTGMYFCLRELRGTVDYIYDCTVAYEGVPRDKYGQDFFSLAGTYFQGRPPRSVNFYWRRFRVDEVPLEDSGAFDAWLRERWYEKDDLMESYVATGRFPGLPGIVGDKDGSGEKEKDVGGRFVETEVRTRKWWEFTQMFVVLAAITLVVSNVLNAWQRFRGKEE